VCCNPQQKAERQRRWPAQSLETQCKPKRDGDGVVPTSAHSLRLATRPHGIARSTLCKGRAMENKLSWLMHFDDS
jgi:hypothetical protein